jgi:hypothetical protein
MAKKATKKEVAKGKKPATKTTKQPAAKKAAKVNLADEVDKLMSEVTLNFNEANQHLESFRDGKKVSGGRLRKSLMLVRKLSQELRKTVMLRIKEMKAEKLAGK